MDHYKYLHEDENFVKYLPLPTSYENEGKTFAADADAACKAHFGQSSGLATISSEEVNNIVSEYMEEFDTFWIGLNEVVELEPGVYKPIWDSGFAQRPDDEGKYYMNFEDPSEMVSSPGKCFQVAKAPKKWTRAYCQTYFRPLCEIPFDSADVQTLWYIYELPSVTAMKQKIEDILQGKI